MTSSKRAPRGSRFAQAKASIQDLRALAADPAAQEAHAVEIVTSSRNLEVLREALAILGQAQNPEHRPLLHRAYARLNRKTDQGGFVRASILRTLRPIVHQDDRPLLMSALLTYEEQGLYELCSDLRAAALLALHDLDPEQSYLFAARFLSDPRTAFSDEPALTAIRLLHIGGQTAPLFAFVSWRLGSSLLVGEALRQLTDLPAELVPVLIETYGDSTDSSIRLGLYDLLLAHPERERWRHVLDGEVRTTDDLDLFAVVTTQIVAARDEPLIATLRELMDTTNDRAKYELLQHALQHL